MRPPITATRARRAIASIAAVPSLIKRVALSRALASIFALIVLATLVLGGCGGDDEGGGDIPATEATRLLGQLEEVQANVDVGSCFVAADEAENLVADVQELPDDVDSDLRRALENGAEQLTILLNDPDRQPDECQQQETTTTTPEETTTEETTTEEETKTRETTTEPTTPTQTQTQTSPGPGGSGGVGPGGQGGL
jgi:hypothetical protein